MLKDDDKERNRICFRNSPTPADTLPAVSYKADFHYDLLDDYDSEPVACMFALSATGGFVVFEGVALCILVIVRNELATVAVGEYQWKRQRFLCL